MPSHYRINYLLFSSFVFLNVESCVLILPLQHKVCYLSHPMTKRMRAIFNNEKFFFSRHSLFLFSFSFGSLFIWFLYRNTDSAPSKWIKARLTSIVWWAYVDIICIGLNRNLVNEKSTKKIDRIVLNICCKKTRATQ